MSNIMIQIDSGCWPLPLRIAQILRARSGADRWNVGVFEFFQLFCCRLDGRWKVRLFTAKEGGKDWSFGLGRLGRAVIREFLKKMGKVGSVGR